MGHRTQITLTDAQYASLKQRSERTGATLSELVRRAVRATYGVGDTVEDEAFEESFGAWRDRELDGAAYVDALRPGLGRRPEG
jgi:hypothetical protein